MKTASSSDFGISGGAASLRRGVLHAAAIAAILLISAFSEKVYAQSAVGDFIEPRVTVQQFHQLCQHIGIDPSQRSITETLFSHYTQTLTDLTARLQQEAAAAGEQQVLDALAGRGRLSSDELAQRRIAVLRVYEQAGPVADEALADLLFGLEVILTPEQTARFPAAVRALRRAILLHPRQAASNVQEYAGDGVDVLALADEAMREGGELHGISPHALADILTQYEYELDALLVETAAAHRQGKVARRIADIEKNRQALQREQQAALKRWQQLYELNRHAVTQIGEIVRAQLGEAASQRWKERFDRASFTWLYPRRTPDRQIEWMRHAQLDDALMQQAEAIYAEYVKKRNELSRRAIELMLRSRIEFQTILYAMMDPTSMDDRMQQSLHQELLRNTGEVTTLETHTAAMLENLLDEQTRKAMRDALKRPDSHRRW